MSTTPMGPPYYGPPAPPTPPKKKHTGLIVALSVLGAFVLLCGGIGIAVVSSLSHTGSSNDAGSAGKPGVRDTHTTTSAHVGTPARDGSFEFVVKKVHCGVSRIGSTDLGKTAQGQYCVVTMTVRNIKSDPQTFDSSNQYAYDRAGHRLGADTEGDLYLENGNSAFLNDINPGNTATGDIAFDIPKTAGIARFELHDSPFSAGVTVTNP